MEGATCRLVQMAIVANSVLTFTLPSYIPKAATRYVCVIIAIVVTVCVRPGLTQFIGEFTWQARIGKHC